MPISDLQGLSDQFAAVVEKASQSVLRVDARHRVAGTGIVWSADGVVVTADHVVEREEGIEVLLPDRKSTRLNSSHRCISYAVFCLKKKIPERGTRARRIFASAAAPSF